MSGKVGLADSYSRHAQTLLFQAILDMPFEDMEYRMANYSVAVSPTGIHSLIDRLVEQLETFPNVTLEKGSKVVELKPLEKGCSVTVADSSGNKTFSSPLVISTISAQQIAKAVSSIPSISQPSSQIPFTNIAVVNVFIPKKQIAHNWFGYLIPKTDDEKNPEAVLGVIFDSSVRNAAYPIERQFIKDLEDVLVFGPTIDPDLSKIQQERVILTDSIERKPDPPLPEGTTLTVMIGGPLWKDLSKKGQLPSADQVIKDAIKAISRHLSVDLKDSDYTAKVKFLTNCIPQYAVGHADKVTDIKSAVAKEFGNSLFLSGTSFGRGVGIGDCVVDSFTIASRFFPERKLLFPEFYVNNWLSLTHPSLIA